MRDQDVLCKPFDHGQSPELVKAIIHSLPSLSKSVKQCDNPARTLCHYESTLDIKTFGDGVLDNVNSKLYSRKIYTKLHHRCYPNTMMFSVAEAFVRSHRNTFPKSFILKGQGIGSIQTQSP